MSVPTRATWRHIPVDGILHLHCNENLKYYKQSMFANRGMNMFPWFLRELQMAKERKKKSDMVASVIHFCQTGNGKGTSNLRAGYVHI
jgi:hypothetical protein